MWPNPQETADLVIFCAVKAVAKYENHPTVRPFKNTIENSSTYSFQCVNESYAEKEIANFNYSKAWQDSNMPVKISKGNLDDFLIERTRQVIDQLVKPVKSLRKVFI